MPILCRPHWLTSPSGRKLNEIGEQELVAEIVALNVDGLDASLPADDLVLKYLRHLVSVAEKDGIPAVGDYLRKTREGLAA